MIESSENDLRDSERQIVLKYSSSLCLVAVLLETHSAKTKHTTAKKWTAPVFQILVNKRTSQVRACLIAFEKCTKTWVVSASCTEADKTSKFGLLSYSLHLTLANSDSTNHVLDFNFCPSNSWLTFPFCPGIWIVAFQFGPLIIVSHYTSVLYNLTG